jgi:hypothetical protein
MVVKCLGPVLDMFSCTWDAAYMSPKVLVSMSV